VAGIFISYRRDDSAGYAGRLRESLEERFGAGQVFRDVDTIEPGQDFVHAIEERVHACNVFLALIGQEWLAAKDRAGQFRLQQQDDYVRREIGAALARSDLVVIPVLTEGVTMPGTEQLPEELHTLARRQAVSLRDESWDQDVDRLAGAIRKVLHPDAVAATGRTAVVAGDRSVRRRPAPIAWAALGALTIALAVLVPRWLRDETSGVRSDPGVPGNGGSDSQVVTRRGGPGSPAGDVRTMRLDLPRVAEFWMGKQIYSLLWAGLTPRGNTRRLRLRLRFVNESPYDANFRGDQFRLAVGGNVLAPVDGPEALVPGRTIVHGVVVFDVPAAANGAVLRLAVDREQGELPLDFTPAGVLQPEDTADPGDANSRAIFLRLPITFGTQLSSDADAEYTVNSGYVRRFANRLRVQFEVRLANRSSRDQYLGSNNFRLLARGEVLAPVEDPAEVVAGNSTRSMDLVWAVPTGTQRIVLRMIRTGQPPVDLPFDLTPRNR
jgi:hypothetical protein